MNKSDSIVNIAPALLAAQRAIRTAVKGADNPYFESKYADLKTIIEAVKGPLNDNGICFIQGLGWGQHGVTVETMFLHSSGEWMSSTLEVPVSKLDAQAVGSATAYGKRYGLQAMGGLPTEDDDAEAAMPRGKQPKNPAFGKPITPNTGAWEAMSKDEQELLTHVAAGARKLMVEGKFEDAVTFIRKYDLINDAKHALNTRFDSKERRALKQATVAIDMAEATKRIAASTQEAANGVDSKA